MAFDKKTDGVVGTFKIESVDESSRTLDCDGVYEVSMEYFASLMLKNAAFIQNLLNRMLPHTKLAF